jgi:hypothetical protein
MTGVELNDPHVLKTKIVTSNWPFLWPLSLCYKERACPGFGNEGKCPILVSAKIKTTVYLNVS